MSTAAETPERSAEDLVRGRTTEHEHERNEVARAAGLLGEGGDFTLPARHKWDATQVEVIRQTVAKDCTPAELALFLEVAARYQLDPFLKEIYAAKFEGRDGGVTIFTGRDGLLKAAKLTRKFVRLVSAVVRENDHYEVETVIGEEARDANGEPAASRINSLKHKRVGMGSAARGPIVGAWALVWVQGDPEPWFAEATWEDYGDKRQKDGSNRDTSWTINSKKGFPEAMMRKVPESIALRLAFGLAGLVGAEEIGDVPERVQNLSNGGGDAPVLGEMMGDDDLALMLREAIEKANELVPQSWRPAKVAGRLSGADDDGRQRFLDELVRFIRSREGGEEWEPSLVAAKEPEAVEGEVQPEPAAPAESASAVARAAEAVARAAGEGSAALKAGDGEPLTPYDHEQHLHVANQVADLRAGLEQHGDPETEVFGEMTERLASAEESLRLWNELAEKHGEPRLEP